MEAACGFCGHSDAPESLRVELKETIADLIREKNVHIFYVGNHGGFDRMVLGVLQELQASFPVMRYYVVLAYHPQLSAPVSHDAPTLFPEDLETVPKRAAIPRRNKWLVEHSDYLVSYVVRSFGGAAQTLAYAERRNVRIIRLRAGKT